MSAQEATKDKNAKPEEQSAPAEQPSKDEAKNDSGNEESGSGSSGSGSEEESESESESESEPEPEPPKPKKKSSSSSKKKAPAPEPQPQKKKSSSSSGREKEKAAARKQRRRRQVYSSDEESSDDDGDSGLGLVDDLPGKQVGKPVGQAADAVGGAADSVGNVASGLTGGGKDDSGDKPLRLRLDLNLDVQLELKAKVHGDVTLALFSYPTSEAPRRSPPLAGKLMSFPQELREGRRPGYEVRDTTLSCCLIVGGATVEELLRIEL